jgi:hypothetical protein
MLLFIVTVLVASAVAAGFARAKLRGGRNHAGLGSMSDQWLAEYRAMHSS